MLRAESGLYAASQVPPSPWYLTVTGSQLPLGQKVHSAAGWAVSELARTRV